MRHDGYKARLFGGGSSPSPREERGEGEGGACATACNRHQPATLLTNLPIRRWIDAMVANRPIGVAGAGSIGCFVGGMLAAGGRRVALLARPRVIGEIKAGGLRLTSFEGFDRNIAANQLTLS